MLSSGLMDGEGAGLMDVVSTVLLVGGVGILLVGGAAAVVIAVAVRRLRRSGVMATTALRLRTITESGPRREVARLRLQLAAAVNGGRAAIGAGGAGTGLPGESSALFRRIQREAGTLDSHLRVLQTEDDGETLRAALPALRRRVAEVADLVRRLRAAVADGMAAVSDSSMAELGADVEREVIALRTGRERLRGSDPSAGGPTWTGGGAGR